MGKIGVFVPDDLHRRVKAKAADSGCTISDVVRVFLELWAKGDEPTDLVPESLRQEILKRVQR
jgi:antitoxin component of RelBE/YafQ-DinJ toxin-antitoxin module